jgi:amino acid permease
MRTDRLSPLEATSLMVGAGVGAGIMAIPWLVARTGLLELAVVLVAAYGATCLVHLLLAEVCIRTGEDLQLVELVRLYLLRDRRWIWVVWLAFVLLALAFLAALAAYVLAAAEILTDLTGLPSPLAQLLVYLVSAGVVFFGLGAVGRFEQLGALALVACTAILAIGALGVPLTLPVSTSGGWTDLLALYGLVMYGFATYFSIPQVVKGTAPDGRAAVRAILAGLGINGLLIGVIAVVAVGVSQPVTEVAVVGIADRLGSWAGTVGSLFILAALLTTYWAVSLALADMVRERTGISWRPAWLLATLPSLLILFLGLWSFVEYLSVAAGATAAVVALITVPMFRNARRYGDVAEPSWTLGRLGDPAWLGLALLASVLMVIGAILAF